MHNARLQVDALRQKFFSIAIFFTATLAVCLTIRAGAAENIWVDAAVNTRLVKTGELFRFVVTAGAKNGMVYLPGRGVVLPDCQVLNYQEKDVSKRHEGYLAVQGVYTLAAFSLEDIIIPSLPIKITWPQGDTATAYSVPIQIKMRSMYPEAGLSLIDPRAPRQAPRIWELLVLAGFCLLLVVWIIRGKAGRPKKSVPRLPAHIEAMRGLEKLGKSKIVTEATRSDQYFTELSRIIRHYIANRFHFPALEMPRTAIVNELITRGVEAKRRELINRLLKESDLVKFAQEAVDYKRVAEAHGLAREIIMLTKEPDESGQKVGRT